MHPTNYSWVHYPKEMTYHYLRICVLGTLFSNPLANKSAAELLGAAATILARLLLFQICLIASVMVTVFPVPGGPKIIYGIPGMPPK